MGSALRYWRGRLPHQLRVYSLKSLESIAPLYDYNAVIPPQKRGRNTQARAIDREIVSEVMRQRTEQDSLPLVPEILVLERPFQSQELQVPVHVPEPQVVRGAAGTKTTSSKFKDTTN